MTRYKRGFILLKQSDYLRTGNREMNLFYAIIAAALMDGKLVTMRTNGLYIEW